MKTQIETPWLGRNGKLLSDEQIKIISKDWTEETWENFLSATVDREASHNETTKSQYDELCEKQTEPIWGLRCLLPLGVQEEIQSAIKDLNGRQQKVIRFLYWQDMSVRQIAKKENLAPSRIHRIKSDSLCRIKGLLENSMNTSHYLIGRSEKSDLPLDRDQEIKEVYRADLEGSYLK